MKIKVDKALEKITLKVLKGHRELTNKTYKNALAKLTNGSDPTEINILHNYIKAFDLLEIYFLGGEETK